MSKKFYTSDWHLNSSGIIKVAQRPFKSVEKMNSMLIRNCNQRAKGTYIKEVLVDKSTGNPILDSNGEQIMLKKTVERDIVIHVGDLCEYGDDNHYKNSDCRTGLKINPQSLVASIDATFVNIEGNHDKHNRVKSLCKYIMTTLGEFDDVSVGHYPSWYEDACGTFVSYHGKNTYTVRICGHVHEKWKWAFDEFNHILNVNVGVDQWRYQIVSESELIGYIGGLKRIIKEKYGFEHR